MRLGTSRETQSETDEEAAAPEQQWEYLARNLAKIPGMALENDFNKLGVKGWEFVAMASGGREGYAIFKRPASNPLRQPSD